MRVQSEQKRFQTPSYVADVFLDYFNQRVRVENYRGNIKQIMIVLDQLVDDHQFTKIIFHAKPEQWTQLLSFGFELEAVFKGYSNGSDQYAMAKYKTNDRRTSEHWVKEDDILLDVYQKGRDVKAKELPEEYTFRRAIEKDSTKLAELYNKVFDIYPTPMNEAHYVQKVIQTGSIFYIVECKGEIVSAASADVNRTYHNAELTDCATVPEHRKYGLMKKILQKLEEELKKEQIFCAFSIARSLSFGMNAVFYQLGFDYTGRLRKNCYIYDKLEDMNVWVKDLSDFNN
ncbi:putative beta-lysine N-acetyltransferase [Alkalihalobacillus sp. MEB130]|uniref:putative beta-lysine N-acetyltransferase n=1 Tax=Alkalihalobacillus sp. MEB130 TaxID=2976704 RepID=UPI0028DDC9EB|nr:putative beta-lysine N-acetyltransferase [Alkalihalobacillus sp. MEB130]MDT8861556.1 putative beta-lysine N-acetyltransferase [Alkalihalobacillus sp. MEB130]